MNGRVHMPRVQKSTLSKTKTIRRVSKSVTLKPLKKSKTSKKATSKLVTSKPVKKSKKRPVLTKLYPNISLDVEPIQSGKVVYLPLIRNSKYPNGQSKIVLKLKIKNKESKPIKIWGVRVSFPKSSYRSKSFSLFQNRNDGVILKPNQEIVWATLQHIQRFPLPNGKYVEGIYDERIILNGPGPKYISIEVSAQFYRFPFRKELEIKPHRSPTYRGSYRFPLRSSHEFIHTKFFRTHSDHLNDNGKKGGQIFAHDIDVVRLNRKGKPDLFKFDNLDEDAKKLNQNYVGWGENIYSIASGYVEEVEKTRIENYPAGVTPELSDKYGGGNFLKIRYGDELVFYAHLQRGSIPKNLRKGSFVRSGQYIGKVGNSGRSSHPHIHIESNTSKGFRPIPFHAVKIVDKGRAIPVDGKGIPRDLSLITTL